MLSWGGVGGDSFIIVAEGDQVFVYALLNGEIISQGAPIANYRAPAIIDSVSCMGEFVCV
jgi:hypothetical protein